MIWSFGLAEMENEDSLKSLFNSSHYPISWVIQRKELNVENIKS